MAVLFTGGLVYLVLEEKYRKNHDRIKILVDEKTPELIAQMRAKVEEFLGPDKISKTLDAYSGHTQELTDTLSRIVEEDNQAFQRDKDAIDEWAVAVGRPDLAHDPLSAEFRLAMGRKKSE